MQNSSLSTSSYPKIERSGYKKIIPLLFLLAKFSIKICTYFDNFCPQCSDAGSKVGEPWSITSSNYSTVEISGELQFLVRWMEELWWAKRLGFFSTSKIYLSIHSFSSDTLMHQTHWFICVLIILMSLRKCFDFFFRFRKSEHKIFTCINTYIMIQFLQLHTYYITLKEI